MPIDVVVYKFYQGMDEVNIIQYVCVFDGCGGQASLLHEGEVAKKRRRREGTAGRRVRAASRITAVLCWRLAALPLTLSRASIGGATYNKQGEEEKQLGPVLGSFFFNNGNPQPLFCCEGVVNSASRMLLLRVHQAPNTTTLLPANPYLPRC